MSDNENGLPDWWKQRISEGLLNSPNRYKLKANLGKKFSYEHRLKISMAQIGKKRPKLSKEWRDKIAEAGRHRKHTKEELVKMSESNKGKKRSLETRRKISEARSKQVFPLKDTKIEVIVQNWFKEKGILIIPHKVFKVGESYHQVDIYVPIADVAIECDGIYWHSLLKSKIVDERVNFYVPKQCSALIRLSEKDILSGEFEEMLGQVFVS